MSRAGRKRKDGPRHPGGQLVKAKPEDDKIRTSRQPHRRGFAQELRTAEEAESPVGRLWLKGYLKLKGDVDSQAARDRYDAGNMFAQVVGAYLSSIVAPGGVSGSGQKSSCTADLLCALDPDECLCFSRRRRYTRAYEALAGGARISLEVENASLPALLQAAIGEAERLRADEAFIPVAADRRRVVMAVVNAVIHREPIGTEDLVYLVRGLETLRHHFGLTTRRKPKHY